MTFERKKFVLILIMLEVSGPATDRWVLNLLEHIQFP